MKTTRILMAGAVLASCLLTLSLATAADEPSKEELEKIGKRADAVTSLSTAAQLASFGRGEMADATGLKGFKSPEALVAAGGLYMRASKATGGKLDKLDCKVTDEKGEEVKGDGKAPTSFADEAKALFDEARGMATKGNSAAIEKLIKMAENIEERGAIGGPKTFARTVQSGRFHTFTIQFEPQAPASVTVRSTSNVQFEVLNPSGGVMWHGSPARNHNYSWNTVGKQARSITVKILNPAGPPASYTVLTN